MQITNYVLNGISSLLGQKEKEILINTYSTTALLYDTLQPE